MSEILIVQGVFDEAGDTGVSPGSSRYLVVAGIVCSNLEPLRRVVMRTRKTLGKKLRQIPEFKASHTPSKIVSQMLSRIAQLDVRIYAAILDKQSAEPPADLEDWYRQIYGECIRLVVAHHPRVTITMDRRYTQASLRDKLVQTIVTNAQLPGATLSFVMADSQNEKALQVADVVAWSIFHKYTHGDTSFYDLIEEKIEGEALLLR